MLSKDFHSASHKEKETCDARIRRSRAEGLVKPPHHSPAAHLVEIDVNYSSISITLENCLGTYRDSLVVCE